MATFFARHDRLNRAFIALFFALTASGFLVNFVYGEQRMLFLSLYGICVTLSIVIGVRAARKSRYAREFTETQWMERREENPPEDAFNSTLQKNAEQFVEWAMSTLEATPTFVAYSDVAPPIASWPGMQSECWRVLVIKKIRQHPKAHRVRTLIFSAGLRKVRPDRSSWSCLLSSTIVVPTRANHVYDAVL